MRKVFFFLLMSALGIFLVAFISNRKHLLATLLSLEGMMFMIFGLLYLTSMTSQSVWPLLFVFLTLTVCEGATGLAILVSIVRAVGSDTLNSLNLLQC